MELRNLPKDALLIIAEFLDSTDVATLYATFDRNIQRALSASGALRRFVAPKNLTGPFLYLLKSIRNVNELNLEGVAHNGEALLPLLPSLNPQVLRLLELEVLYTNPTTASDGKEASAEPLSAAAASYKNWSSRLIAESSSIASIRAKSIHNSAPRAVHNTLASTALPQGLQSLRIAGSMIVDLDRTIKAFPSSLTELRMNSYNRSNFSLSACLKCFPSLTRLTVIGPNVRFSTDDLESPTALSDLRIGFSSTIPIQLLQSNAFKSLKSLTRLELTTLLQWPSDCSDKSIEERRIDLRSILPHSLMYLLIHLPGRGSFTNAIAILDNFPSSLTKLSINAHHFDAIAGFPKLSYLKNLKRLEVNARNYRNSKLRFANSKTPLPHQDEPPIPTLHIHTLPRSLIVLKLQGAFTKTLAEDDIADLPPSLQTLVVSAFDLSLVPQFVARWPNASVIIIDAINLLNREYKELFEAIVSSTAPDTASSEPLIEAVRSHFARSRVFLSLYYDASSILES